MRVSTSRFCCAVIVAISFAAATCARAQSSPPLTLTQPPPIAKDIDAFPRISSPVDPQTARINQALDAADARLRAAVVDCKSTAGSGSDFSWERGISVTMNGPRYVSFSVSDNSFCGGAHPDQDMFALVYDLQTGKPVNWARLLPPDLAGSASLDEADDETKIGVLASPLLSRLFIAALDKDGNAECANDVNDPDEPLHFIIWPDASENALELYSQDVPFVDGPCAGPEALPLTALRQYKIDSGLLAAIAAAHAQQQPTKQR